MSGPERPPAPGKGWGEVAPGRPPRHLQVGQTFLSAGLADFPVAPAYAGLESPANRQAGKPALRPVSRSSANSSLHGLLLVAAAFLTLATARAESDTPPAWSAEQLDYFETRIRPVLVEHCYPCHGAAPDKAKGGLRLDTRAAVLKGGNSGPALTAGDPETSLLIKAVRYVDADLEMPPNGKRLTAEQVADFEAWVAMGAPDPRVEGPSSVRAPATTLPDARVHWAFQPVVKPPLPAPADPEWGTNPIDRLVRSKLEANEMAPSPPADKRTLLRRVTYDLTGLPPTPEAMDAFLADPSPAAYPAVVDRLLASPAYGERWGRYWLDVARYADTKGYVFQEERRYPFAWTYRDYVIRAFNEDKPYDRFLLEQLAADQLAPGEDNQALAAMGFLTLGRRFLNNPHDIIDDRIDVTMRGLQALTVGCARCHDHKFDPISMADYYGVYGVFASSKEPAEKPILQGATDPAKLAEFQQEKARLEAELEKRRTEETAKYLAELRQRRGDYEQAARELAALSEPQEQALRKLAEERNLVAEVIRRFLKASEPGASPVDPLDIPMAEARRLGAIAIDTATASLRNQLAALEVTHAGAPARAMVLIDRGAPTPARVFLRGNPGNPGPEVPRQFLEILSGPERKPFAKGSGRLELAQAIASPANPLTARVLVNRIWLGHFGQGLVRTPSDFGVRTAAPPHRELLDYLAATFVEEGWSIKALHRQILLSHTYQQSSAFNAGHSLKDAENQLLWRMNPRRLDFEALRDTLLVAGGNLDPTLGGRPVEIAVDAPAARRTVYGFIDRQNLPGLFRTFDLASPDTTSPQRFVTTVPQQALFLMNNPFVVEQARLLAARRAEGKPGEETAAVQRLYRILYQREPAPDEVAAARQFLQSCPDRSAGSNSATAQTAWDQYAQVLLQSNELAFLD